MWAYGRVIVIDGDGRIGDGNPPWSLNGAHETTVGRLQMSAGNKHLLDVGLADFLKLLIGLTEALNQHIGISFKV